MPSPDLLVAQSNAEVLFVKDEQWISTSAPIKLTGKDKKLDGILSAPTTQWFMGESKDDQTHVLSSRSPDGRLQKQLSKLVITDSGGKVVGLVKHGDVKDFEKGLGRAVLYASSPPTSGGSGHATVTESDVTLHAAYEIRVPDDAAHLHPIKGFAYPYSKAWYQKDGGIGAFAVGANGAFSAQPAFKLVMMDKCQMMDKYTLSNATGELVATVQSTQATQIGKKKEVTVAPGVEVVLPVVFASIVMDFFNRSPMNG